MKKAAGLVLAVTMVGFLLFYLRTWAPFMGIMGKSMEPELEAGDLIFIKSALPSVVKEGDVIVFEIPSQIRDYYHYPLVVAHRVKEVHQRGGETVFRTKGDNTGEDPFVVRTIDMRGIVGKKISHLGFLLLFFQSRQGLISMALVLLFIGLETYSPEMNRLKQWVQKGVFSPVLEKQEEHTRALKDFSSAMQEYARHLASHTKAVQDLARAAEKLEEVAEKLNKKLN